MSLLALTDAQISTWVASFMLPLFRVGALLTTMPIIGTTLVPKRIKLFLSLAITLAIMPSLPPLPTVNPLDLSGLLLIAEQIIIGATGQGGLSSILIGSVSREVARHSRLPVTIVKLPEALETEDSVEEES